MNKEMELYEAVIRASLILIFLFALTLGTYGLVSVCWLLIQSNAPRPDFVTTPPSDLNY